MRRRRRHTRRPSVIPERTDARRFEKAELEVPAGKVDSQPIPELPGGGEVKA